MPAVALVGAAASVSMGVTAMAAATTIGASLAAGAMIAGGVLTGLGTITGNKKLSRIGAVLGIGGGIGTAMSNSASAAGSAASAGGEGVAMGTAAGNAGSNAVEFGLLDNVGGAASSAFTTPVPTPSGIVGSELGGVNSVGGQAQGAFFGDMAPATAADAAAAGATPQATAMQQDIAAVSNQAGSGPITDARGVNVGAGTNPLGNALGKLGDWAGGVSDYINNPKNAGVVKLGSGLVQGAMGSYNQQQQLQQQIAAREAERARFNRSIIGQYVTR